MPLSKVPSFRQLIAFHAVARLGSVSQAARELHLTQPALSIQIGLLEASAGEALLERFGRGIRLTAAGERLARHVGRILDIWREAGEEFAQQQGVFSGTLRLGVVSTAEYLLPALLVTFASRHSRVKLRMQVGNRNQILHLLASEQIDVALMGTPPSELKLAAMPFAKNPMGFMAAAGHRLLRDPALSLATLAGEPLLVRESGSGSRTAVERLFKAEGLQFRIGSELSSNEAIKQLCAAGFGPAYMSLHSCMLELSNGLLRLLPLANNPVEREWYVAHLASRPLPQVALAFESFVLEYGQAEIRERLERGLAGLLRPQDAPGAESGTPAERSGPV
jgi:LysR family transcriptional regulator, low CO2-responsive transcriptional regulator